jgi:hypothetical protein
MHKLLIVVLLLLPWSRTFAQDSSLTDQYPNAPSAELPSPPPLPPNQPFAPPNPAPSSIPQQHQLLPLFDPAQSRTTYTSPAQEPYHWKGLILQSFAFNSLENSVRIMTANQSDRHILLNKPYWSDYFASLGQFNMRRWNDGDSFPVNYIGHPLEGAIAGYIEVQNDPRGRDLKFSSDRHYWNSRFRALLWATAYSTHAEIGPLGEAAIFNEGGFTYPIGCHHHDPVCEATAKYTNNTGWVDFIITPVVGTLLLIGEDAIDHYITDPLVEHHPHEIGYQYIRAAANPNRSLANILRGHRPFYRDYEHPGGSDSPIVGHFEHAMEIEPRDHADLNFFYSYLGLGTNHIGCIDCRTYTRGAGMELGISFRRYLDFITTARYQPDPSPVASATVGGSFFAMNFGLRSGYSGQYFALKLSIAPGFASWERTLSTPTATEPDPPQTREFTFSATATISGDIRFTDHLAFRTSVDQMLIRYKSPYRDPPGIGEPPRLSFLSHDNYINSTNWGVRLGPVFRF